MFECVYSLPKCTYPSCAEVAAYSHNVRQPACQSHTCRTMMCSEVKVGDTSGCAKHQCPTEGCKRNSIDDMQHQCDECITAVSCTLFYEWVSFNTNLLFSLECPGEGKREA